MVAEIQADADNLARTADWRSEAQCVVNLRGRKAVFFEPALKTYEPIAAEEFFVVVRTEAGSVQASAVAEENSRPLLAGRAKADQFH